MRNTVRIYKAVCAERMKHQQGDNNMIIILPEAATKTLISGSSFPDVTREVVDTLRSRGCLEKHSILNRFPSKSNDFSAKAMST